MGKLEELVKKLKGKNEDEIIEELGQVGDITADKIAETMGQNDRTSFVPKVDVLPIELPEGCEINECGEIIRKGKEEADRDEK